MPGCLKKIDRRIGLWFARPFEFERRQEPLEIDTSNALRERGATAIFDAIVVIMLASVVLAGWQVSQHCCMPSAISQFYWRPLGGLIMSLLSVVAGMMILQRGETMKETFAGIFGGLALLGVVWFPTGVTACTDPVPARLFGEMMISEDRTKVVPTNWMEAPFGPDYMNSLHVLSVVLFVLILFAHCRWIFTRMVPDLHEGAVPISGKSEAETYALRARKAARNRVYRCCSLWIAGAGALMAAITILGARDPAHVPDWLATWRVYGGTFFVELIVLMAFTYAWGVKGRVLREDLQDEKQTKYRLFFLR